MKSQLAAKSIYLTALMAFVIYALLPFFAVYNLPSTDSQQLSSLFGEKVLICTSDGFKFVSWKDLADRNNSPKQHSNVKCPLCYFTSHGMQYTPQSVLLALAYDAQSIVLRYWQYNEILLSRDLHSNYQPRAPPSLFII